MIPQDLEVLKERLAEVWGARNARPPEGSGLKGWFIPLKDLPVELVVDSLDRWNKTNPKLPTPPEIRAAALQLRDEGAARRARAQADMAAAVRLDQVRPATPDSAAYREFLAWRRLHNSKKRPSGISWAAALREREEAGEVLLPAQSQAWRAALGADR
ncbi:ABC-type dipeptide transport system, periplasmic component [Burkholderiales bacterium GJ-E10]|nr:ABC-type dipeptide transport system, periplasmic component [Burkholderiales bacterium GJ-E10]